MLQRLQIRTRTILAMLCVALMAMLAGQGAIISVDKAQHALGVAHAPTPLAGAVHYDHDDHHEADRVAHDEVLDADHADDGDRPTPHHHFAEGPQMAAPVAERLAQTVSVRRVELTARRFDAPALLVTARLERPPKASSKTLA